MMAVTFFPFFFFFKQKTAYEIMPSLVGSEMCIRDRVQTAAPRRVSAVCTVLPLGVTEGGCDRGGEMPCLLWLRGSGRSESDVEHGAGRRGETVGSGVSEPPCGEVLAPNAVHEEILDHRHELVHPNAWLDEIRAVGE